MNFQIFYSQFYEVGCFSVNQVHAVLPGFNNNNLVNWTKKNLLVKLRNGHYCFPQYLKHPNFSLLVANRIYKPSYVSLHTALSFYGLIPESVIQITSVTSLKTAEFSNAFGVFTYQTMKPDLFFGYESKPLPDGKTILIADPEKAILDLLYLYPAYDNEDELLALRLDEDYLHQDINKDRLLAYVAKSENKALDRRARLLLNAYAL